MAYFSGVKSFWAVQKSQPINDTIEKFNSRNNAPAITTYHF